MVEKLTRAQQRLWASPLGTYRLHAINDALTGSLCGLTGYREATWHNQHRIQGLPAKARACSTCRAALSDEVGGEDD